MERIKKTKFFISIQKERKWLEDMAKEGYLLEDILMGVKYTFVKSEPKNMIYDIDRFDLPKKPTLEEIRHKEMFLDMAKEMGWKEVTHDEGQTYYFTKEYIEGDINELHNDEEARMYRAKKFRNFFLNEAKGLLIWMILVGLINTLFTIFSIDEKAYQIFCHIYVLFCSIYCMATWKFAYMYEKELSMTREEWEQSVNPNRNKTVKKLILTIGGLKKFLEKQQQEGWILKGVTPLTYSFVKSDEINQVYTMDTKWLTNKRCKGNNKKFTDLKDINGTNNDWQVQSVKDAEEKGWRFVCALENKGIIYKGDKCLVQPLNEEKDNNGLRSVSLIGNYGIVIIIVGIIGFVFGFLNGMI